MKYIKLYEDNTKPQIGDYILIYPHRTYRDDLQEFLRNNIGIVVGIDKYNDRAHVKYNNVPSALVGVFPKQTISLEIKDYVVKSSPNKEEVETVLRAKKYNI